MIGWQVTFRGAMTVPVLLVAASCAAIPQPAAPPPPPPPVEQPAPPPAPAPVVDPGWEDRALTPGDWRYDGESRTASFGVAGAAMLASLRCEGGAIILSVPGLASANGARLRTSSGEDALALRGGELRLAANDPRLDRIIFSRGRFAIEDAQGRALTLPSWAEIARVVEDCRGG